MSYTAANGVFVETPTPLSRLDSPDAAAVAATGTIKLRHLVAAIQARYRAARNFNARTRAPMLDPAFAIPVTFTGTLTTATSATLIASVAAGAYWCLFSDGSTRVVTANGVNVTWSDAIASATASATLFGPPTVNTGVTFTGALAGVATGLLTTAQANGTVTMLFSDGSIKSATITGGTTVNWTGNVTATASASICGTASTTPVKVKTGAAYSDVVGSNIHYAGADLVNQSLVSARGGFARISGNNVVVESTTVANGVVAGSIDFVFTGRCLVIGFGASSVRTRIKVDGRYISGYQHLAGWSSMTLLFDFGASNKPGTKRVISIPMQGNIITDIWIDATGTIQPVETSPRIMWCGDSKAAFWYRDAAALAAGDSSYLWYGNDVYTRQLADYLGCPDVWPSALPGTGYINPNSGAGYVKFRDRITADITNQNPDVIVLDYSGDNDTGDTTAGFLASVAQIRAWSATVPIIVYDGNIQQTRAARAAYIAAAAQSLITAGDTYLKLVKRITGTPKFSYGTGNEGSPTNNGPADWVFGADDVHNTLTGHDALAIHGADTFVGALESLVA